MLEVLTLVKQCRLKANIKSRIPVYVYDGFKSPCTLGIIKPKIYIPKYVLSIKDNNQLSHIFLHELMHYKRKDLIYNFLGIIALLIHWFNPLVWFAIKKMKLYREYACDACVLELLNEEENIEYGMTLLSLSKMLLNKGNYSQLPVFFETNNQIKDRIWMIKGFKKGSYKMTARAVLGCTIATIVILTNNLAVKALDADNIIPIAVNDIEKLKEDYKSNVDEVNTVKNDDTANIKESEQNVASTNNASNDTSSKGKWVQDKGKWYYYNSDGVMQKSTTIDGYKLGEDGALIDDKVANKTDNEADKAARANKTNDATNKTVSANGGANESDVGQDQTLNPPINSDGRPVEEMS